jgi:pimeloyl-ACP methyl ester carboxylesterase
MDRCSERGRRFGAVPNRFRRAIGALSSVLALLLLPQPGLASPDVPRAEDFFHHPAVTDEQLSPDGRHLAILIANKDGRIGLTVADTERPADRLRQPLLMAHGGEDVRVPVLQGTTFRDKVRTTNKNVEWIEYPDEGHGFRLEKDAIDYWRHVEAFLDKYLR